MMSSRRGRHAGNRILSSIINEQGRNGSTRDLLAKPPTHRTLSLYYPVAKQSHDSTPNFARVPQGDASMSLSARYRQTIPFANHHQDQTLPISPRSINKLQKCPFLYLVYIRHRILVYIQSTEVGIGGTSMVAVKYRNELIASHPSPKCP